MTKTKQQSKKPRVEASSHREHNVDVRDAIIRDLKKAQQTLAAQSFSTRAQIVGRFKVS